MGRLIDADELLTHLNACLTNGRPLSNLYDLSEIVSYVESMPTVDAVPVKHGEWVDGRRIRWDGTFYWFRQCSCCDYERNDDDPDKDTPYCPNCGAKMHVHDINDGKMDGKEEE